MRSSDITYTKAIGIILMVMCHSMAYDVPFIYMFHMPLFFFFSGYCLKTEYFDKPQVFAWKRVKGIWWPYVKWSLLFLALHNVLYELNFYEGERFGRVYGMGNFLEFVPNILFRMNKHDGIVNGYWFMRALFFGSTIAFITAFTANIASKKRKNLYPSLLIIGGGILLSICCWLNAKHRTLTILHVGPQSFLAAIFYTIGHLFRYFRIPSFKLWQTAIAFALVLFGSIYWKMVMHAITYENQLMLPYIVTGVLGTWAVYSLPWNRLANRVATLLQFIGNNTLTVLTWHFLIFKLVSLVIIYMYDLPIERLAAIPVITDYADQGWWLVYLLVGMMGSCAIAYCNRWIHSSWLKL